MKRYREAEVTHGRVAMLAVLGFLVSESFHPFFGGEIDGPAIYALGEVRKVIASKTCTHALRCAHNVRAATRSSPPSLPDKP